MLDNNDLKQIKKIMDSGFENFAIIVNNGFNEQNKYIDKRFEYIDKRFDYIDKRFDEQDKRFDKIEEDIAIVKDNISTVKYDIAVLSERFDKLEQKVDKLINTENEDIVAIGIEVEKIKKKLKILETRIHKQSVPA